MVFVHIQSAKETLSLQLEDGCTVGEIWGKINVPKSISDGLYLVSTGKIQPLDEVIVDCATYDVIPKVLGGKGGFGSMLRALGAQIEKTTNREAMRDLSGRRMRDINNEKKLKEWAGKASDREKDKQERRKAKRKLAAEPRHTFNDPEYTQVKMQVAENLEDAVQCGLQKEMSASGPSTSTGISTSSRKRKANEDVPLEAKKFAWFGVDPADLSNSSDSDFDSPEEETGIPSTESSSDSGIAHTTELKSDSDQLSVQDNLVEIPEAPCSSGSMDIQVATEDNGQSCDNIDAAAFDIMQFNSSTQMEILGLDTLKLELVKRGLKCGGTLQERAQRLFSVRGLSKDQIDPHLFAKPQKKKGKSSA